MANDTATIAKRYAVALFELTHDQNSDTTTLAELVELKKVLQENPDLVKTIDSAGIADSDKQALLKTITDQASQLVKNLIEMTYDYRRFNILTKIIDAYTQLVDQADGRIVAYVTTAVPLDADQASRLATSIAKRFNANAVELNQNVDESLIGGVIIHANNQIVDGSLATKLEAIRQSIVR
ncbi:MAG: F0F1 ATP synthase subunit delta [Lactobacillaceae bacterium]|jgi:F-type H+-transporting ATPase subunit delta|nr:F0F1 ATP synthase subunit delta [Lactobacillaceae bacterium]